VNLFSLFGVNFNGTNIRLIIGCMLLLKKRDYQCALGVGMTCSRVQLIQN